MALPIKAFRSSPYTLTNTTEENPPLNVLKFISPLYWASPYRMDCNGLVIEINTNNRHPSSYEGFSTKSMNAKLHFVYYA